MPSQSQSPAGVSAHPHSSLARAIANAAGVECSNAVVIVTHPIFIRVCCAVPPHSPRASSWFPRSRNPRMGCQRNHIHRCRQDRCIRHRCPSHRSRCQIRHTRHHYHCRLDSCQHSRKLAEGTSKRPHRGRIRHNKCPNYRQLELHTNTTVQNRIFHHRRDRIRSRHNLARKHNNHWAAEKCMNNH